MVVQHNLRAMNSNRMLGLTTKAQSKSTEKLSSGYKINRAADDAAGLSISEKMRKQIRGLTQASLNAQDGISAVQTAEGALNEVQDMLQRMNELAIKASNGPMSENDRTYVQNEIDQLVTEIDRVSETTKFNETYLLQGSGKKTGDAMVSGMVGGLTTDAKVVGPKGNIVSGTFNDLANNALGNGTKDTATIEYLDEEGNTKTRDIEFTVGKDAAATAENFAKAVNDDKVLAKIFKASTDATGKLSIESKLKGDKTDETKNNISAITFKSADPATAATRKTELTLDPPKNASGSSYTLQIGKDTPVAIGTAGDIEPAMTWQDGETITINGTTYTFDTGKNADSQANSFASLQDLQNLLGDDYEINLTFTLTELAVEYDNAGNEVKRTNNGEVSTSINAADMGTALDQLDKDSFADQFASEVKANDTTITAYVNGKVELQITAKSDVTKAADTLTLSLQVGADTTEENKISVDLQSMSAKSLGIDGLRVDGKDSSNADDAVNTIADALQQVSTQRSALGAVQNRLEHTINNLDNVVENTTAAESQIRDTDMATEMVKYSNNNILAQAGQSMLAQSNQSNQGVLALLQ